MLAIATRRKPSATVRAPSASPVARDLIRKVGESRDHHFGIERLVRRRTEGRREMRRLNLADADIGVRHGDRADATVAGGPWIGARGVGSNAEAAPSKCRIEPPPAATVLIAIIGPVNQPYSRRNAFMSGVAREVSI
jgi:hypothetical protein